MADVAGASGAAHDAAAGIDETPDPVDEQRLAAGRQQGYLVAVADAAMAVDAAKNAVATSEAMLDGSRAALAEAEAAYQALTGGDG